MLVRRLARPMLASVFVTSGIDTLRNPGPKADAAEPIIDLITEKAQPAAAKVAAGVSDRVDQVAEAVEPGSTPLPEAAAQVAQDVRATVHHVADGRPLPWDSESYVKANAAVQVGAGILLAAGKVPRLASAALAVSLVPTTVGGHRFWEYEGAERQAHQVHFTKNVALLGGLILAAVDTEGKPSLAWRAKHSHLGTDAKLSGRAARANAKAAARLAKANAKLAGKGGKLGLEVAQEAAVAGVLAAGSAARSLRSQAAPHVQHLAEVAGTKGQELAEAVKERDLPDVLAAKGHDLAEAVRSSDLPDVVAARGRDLADAVRSSDLPDVVAARGRGLAAALRSSDLPDTVAARAAEAAELARSRGRELLEAARDSDAAATASSKVDDLSGRARLLVGS